jgi:hypothetical protein
MMGAHPKGLSLGKAKERWREGSSPVKMGLRWLWLWQLPAARGRDMAHEALHKWRKRRLRIGVHRALAVLVATAQG